MYVISLCTCGCDSVLYEEDDWREQRRRSAAGRNVRGGMRPALSRQVPGLRGRRPPEKRPELLLARRWHRHPVERLLPPLRDRVLVYVIVLSIIVIVIIINIFNFA